MATDSYLTIAGPAEAYNRERSSKFLSFAFPVENEEEIRAALEPLRKRFFDATHHCYAWRLGPEGESFRANDDGEPSGTAGRPILGQLLSAGVTNCLVVVVRYFGGTKLGVPGLIAAYKEATQEVLAQCHIIERTVDDHLTIYFPYVVMNDVMRILKEEQPTIIEQLFDNLCTIRLSMRKSLSEKLIGRLRKVEGLTLEINQ
uniref:IMPACT family protein n=1 Tax=Alistipes sp. TaxID=1872444 RepID=UPI004055B507